MKFGKYMRNQAGAIALMAIFLVFFISVLMITLEILRRSDLENVANQIKDLEAYYCAESGIEYAMNRLRSGQNNVDLDQPTFSLSGDCISTDNLLTDRDFSFYAEGDIADPSYIDDNGDPYYHYVHITSTGTSGSYSRRVKMTYRRTPHKKSALNQFIIRWREL